MKIIYGFCMIDVPVNKNIKVDEIYMIKYFTLNKKQYFSLILFIYKYLNKEYNFKHYKILIIIFLIYFHICNLFFVS